MVKKINLRIIDYVANFGGGIRFSEELTKGFINLNDKYSLEVLSSGSALDRYKSVMNKLEIECKFIDLPTENHYKNSLKKILNIPGSQHLRKIFGYGSRWYYPISKEAFEGCDIVWLPWIHQHRPPKNQVLHNVTASFHDAILFQFPDLIKPDFLNDERISVHEWVNNSGANIVVSSNTTLQILKEIFNFKEDQFFKIEIAGSHLKKENKTELLDKFSYLGGENYLFYPANTSPHKNHDNLIQAFGLLKKRTALVLTGAGSDLRPVTKRGRELRRLISKNKLKLQTDIFPIGYVSDIEYESLLCQSKALIMPSLSEGGGSFPLYEALFLGIPALVADVPVLREHMERACGKVIWFDPLDPFSIAESINELFSNYTAYKKIAEDQTATLETRSWLDVANDYQKLFQINK